MKNVLIIGSGQLGSRHMQALLNSKYDLKIDVIDRSLESLELAKQRAEEIKKRKAKIELRFFESIDESDLQVLDLVIIATTAGVRYSVTKELLEKRKVSHLILEKVAFQKVSHFDKIINLCRAKNTKTWVNCPRREFDAFKEMKAFLADQEKLIMTVQGGNWGLGCNTIHLMDLLAFFTNSLPESYSIENLDPILYEANRADVKEFGGLLTFRYTNGSRLTVIDEKDSIAPTFTSIHGKTKRLIISEFNKTVILSTAEKDWELEQKEIYLPYQSELTTLVADKIFETGECNLTTLEESKILHQVLFSALNTHLERQLNSQFESCPIT
ncbi:MAG: hypothetical protein COB67_08950 [SAR324 cluster bacterium]|uniref:Gfo/Idh/MocA-like oxidoreductase N-terminal domain-containing protein n=1 Tax=SAR324 cluster bacterium TaxID=2024889 RepID=A0A2A4T2M0_9DELT|nr:MAG: hypothetical protein COB67_08950 [SAR324 cluster bacterium]